MRFFKSKGSSRKNSASTESLNSFESDQPEHRGKLRKGSVPFTTRTVPPVSRPSLPTIPSQDLPTRNKLSKKPKNDFPVVSARDYGRDTQTGEQKVDHTDLLHSLINDEGDDPTQHHGQILRHEHETAISGTALKERLPNGIWDRILNEIDLVDKVSLSFSCKAFHDHLRQFQSIINEPNNQASRTEYLLRLDKSLPNHLLCFICLKYHRRLSPGHEVLRPTNIANPIYTCPEVSNVEKRISRIRMTSGRTLPFAFAQLLHRHHLYGPLHGISTDVLSRRYKDINVQNAGWTHQTRLCIVQGHLLLRVTSTTFATPGLPPAGLRNLLYNPAEEFHPYFSTCPHWRDGELMPLVKCALSHIPKPIEGSGIKRVGSEIHQRFTYANPLVTLCTECRPMRRCPECPTEYLIEIRMAEDKKEPDPTKLFKQALVVTRWSDLGSGITPEDPEWGACSGSLDGYDSMGMIGKRAIAGVFESQFTFDVIPGQRILNLNPKGVKKGEEGHRWY